MFIKLEENNVNTRIIKIIFKIITVKSRCYMKKLSKSWKIFIITTVVLISSIYGYYKINNRNSFEEMYNSYYNILSIKSIDNMPQIKTISKDDKGADIVHLYYKDNTNNEKIALSLVNYDNNQKILVTKSILISDTVYLGINHVYNMNSQKLKIIIDFHGKEAPITDDRIKQTRELLEKYNISKEYLQKKSDELLDTVLTDWKRYSGSSYSRSNMGRLTIEKDEFLG